jgi:hypothetical protein
MGREVGAVKAGDPAYDLLRWEPSAADDHIVASDWLGIRGAQRIDNVAAAQNKRMPGDLHLTHDDLLGHGFSALISLRRL